MYGSASRGFGAFARNPGAMKEQDAWSRSHPFGACAFSNSNVRGEALAQALSHLASFFSLFLGDSAHSQSDDLAARSKRSSSFAGPGPFSHLAKNPSGSRNPI